MSEVAPSIMSEADKREQEFEDEGSDFDSDDCALPSDDGETIEEEQDEDGKTPLDAARELSHAAVAKYLSPAERKWRRVGAWALVLSSIRDEEQLTPMMKVLLCDDLAREIQSYL